MEISPMWNEIGMTFRNLNDKETIPQIESSQHVRERGRGFEIGYFFSGGIPPG